VTRDFSDAAPRVFPWFRSGATVNPGVCCSSQRRLVLYLEALEVALASPFKILRTGFSVLLLDLEHMV
jgi:hypothetical protein